MYKMYYSVIVFFLSVTTCNGQKPSGSIIEELISKMNKFENKEFSFGLEYSEEKETFYFSIKKEEELIRLHKLVRSDIHPEGVFLIDTKNEIWLRILSINNHKVFVSEKFVNGFRRSENKAYIDIGNLSSVSKKKLSEFVDLFKRELKDKIPEERNPIIVSPPRTKNN